MTQDHWSYHNLVVSSVGRACWFCPRGSTVNLIVLSGGTASDGLSSTTPLLIVPSACLLVLSYQELADIIFIENVSIEIENISISFFIIIPMNNIYIVDKFKTKIRALKILWTVNPSRSYSPSSATPFCVQAII